MRFVEWAMNQHAKPKEKQLPVEIDVGFTSTVQCEPEACEQIKANYLFLNKMNQTQQHEYVYIQMDF